MKQLRGILGIAIVGVLGWAQVGSAEFMPNGLGTAGWVIEAADYTGEMVKDQIVRLEARYTIRVIRDGWIEIPLALQDVTVTEIKIEQKAGEAHIMPRGIGYILAATRKGTYTVRMKGSSLMVKAGQFEGLHIGIPQATFSTLSLIVPRKDVELRPEDQLYVESQPDAKRGGVKLTARLGASDRIALGWRTKPVTPVTMEPVLYGEVHTLVTVEEQLARLTSIIDYRMAQGEAKELQLHLPLGVNVLNARGGGIEDWRVSDAKDHKMLNVTLGFVLKDTTYRLVIEGEETITETAAEYSLPEVQLVGVKQERGYLAVARDGSIELTPRAMEGINRVDVKELPDLLKAAAGSPAILAFKYHQHPYRVSVALTRHQDHPVLAAIAERGELMTVLSRQGELLTRATYLIKANKKQFVEVVLPEGASLWSCLVDGKSVKPVEGEEGKLLVPMDAMADGARAVPVELVYFERRPELTGIGQLRLAGPVLDVPTTVANWSLYAPREIRFLRMSGNLERGAASFEFLDEPFVQVAAAEPASAPSTVDRVGNLFAAKRSRANKENGVAQWGRDLDGPYDAKNQFQGDASGDEKGKRSFLTALAGLANSLAPFATREDKQFEKVVGDFTSRLQETGILPLKIRLPKSGTVYRFNRLMTTEEALTLDATFVHLRLPWALFAALGLLLLPVGGIVAFRLRRG